MKKTRSTTSFALSNLAASIKQSIQLDNRKLDDNKQAYKLTKSVSTFNMPTRHKINKCTIQEDDIFQSAKPYTLEEKKLKDQRQIVDIKYRGDDEHIEMAYEETDDTVGQKYYQENYGIRNINNKDILILQAKVSKILEQITKIEGKISQNYKTKMAHALIKPQGFPKQEAKQDNYTKLHRLSNYKLQLKKYEETIESLERQRTTLSVFQQTYNQLKQRSFMLYQQVDSLHYNIETNLAEKQHYQEILDLYRDQYESQSEILLKILEKQVQIKHNKQKLSEIKSIIDKKQKQFSQWMEEIDYNLGQKIFENKIKEHRIQLMTVQEKLDKFVENKNQEYKGWYGQSNSNLLKSTANHFGVNGMLKVRQILCHLVKNYVKQWNSSIKIAKNIINLEDVISQGIQLYVCKNQQLFKQFKRQVSSYRYIFINQCSSAQKNQNNLSPNIKQKYPQQFTQSYLSVLAKLYNLITNSTKLFLHRKIHSQYLNQLNQLHIQSISIQQNISFLQSTVIKQFVKKLEQVHASESVAIIQNIREQHCDGKYELETIRPKLKSLKKQQQNRSKDISNIFYQLKSMESSNMLDSKSIQSKNIRHLNQINDVKQKIGQSQLQVKLQKTKVQELQEQKVCIENQMNYVLSKWQQADKLKKQLKILYKQLNHANKQLKESKLESFKQRATISKKKELFGYSMGGTFRCQQNNNIMMKNTLRLTNENKIRYNQINDEQLEEIDKKNPLFTQSIFKKSVDANTATGTVRSIKNSTSTTYRHPTHRSNKQNKLYLNYSYKNAKIGKNQRANQKTDRNSNRKQKSSGVTAKKLPKQFLMQLEKDIGQTLTRKPSLVDMRSSRNINKGNKLCKQKSCSLLGQNNQLTAMLASKLTQF